MSKISRPNRIRKDRIGSVFKTNSFGDIIILQYENARNVRVRFLETGYETVASMPNITEGKLKDLLAKTVYGEGVLGEKEVKVDGEYPKEYLLWRNMLRRCYDKATLAANKTYEGCTVSDNFKYYPYFKEWCNKQVGFNVEGFQLDKDILNPYQKMYSEDTCVFVPIQLNCLTKWNKIITEDTLIGTNYSKYLGKFTASGLIDGSTKHLGVFDTRLEAFYVYKDFKEKQIKAVAEKWKDQIDPRVYEKLINFEFKVVKQEG